MVLLELVGLCCLLLSPVVVSSATEAAASSEQLKWWAVSSIEHVTWDTVPPQPAERGDGGFNGLDLAFQPGESESSQVAIYVGDHVNATLTSVRFDGLPPHMTAAAFKVVHVWCEEGSIYNDPMLPPRTNQSEIRGRWIPDVLIPLEEWGPSDSSSSPYSHTAASTAEVMVPLDPGKTHAIWIRVTAGLEATAGHFTSPTLTLSFAPARGGTQPLDSTPIIIPLHLTVWGFGSVPASTAAGALETIFSFEYGPQTGENIDVGRYFGHPGNFTRPERAEYVAEPTIYYTPPAACKVPAISCQLWQFAPSALSGDRRCCFEWHVKNRAESRQTKA
jgi:hypothetical protein